MDNFPWAQQLLKVVSPNIPRNAEPNALGLDGMYLLHHNSQKLLSALVNAGFIHEKDTGNTEWIRSQQEPKCGLAFCQAPDEPESDVWWFYDHRDG